MERTNTDCLVLGGGPAGSTFASTVLRHAPGARVTVLDKARFPRWQVGESVVPVINAQLEELGLFEKIKRSTFVKKIGNVVVWGPTRQPWSPDFLLFNRPSAGDSGIVDIDGFDYRSLAHSKLPLDQPVVSFNVRRGEFDALLLDRARELGAEVREGTRATRILKDAHGTIESVLWEDDRGGRGEICPRFVVDACGLRSPLTRGERVRDAALKHLAVIGYLRNARWKCTFQGARERTGVFVLSVARGWIWYIPLDHDLVSVGLVTDAEELRRHPKQGDWEALLLGELRGAPELQEVIQGAILADDVMPNRARVRTCQQWSSFVETPVGPNWVAVGDAAMFVDPVVPSGVGFAVQSAHRAAYTWLTQQRSPEVSSTALWEAYAWYVRGEFGAMSRLARLVYGNNGAVQSPFWQRPLLQGSRLAISEPCTLTNCDYFPFPKAFGWKVVAPLLSGIAGRAGALSSVYTDDGLPADLRGCSLEARAPFELALRAEYPTDGSRTGQLRLYHDVVTPARDFYHRLALRPADIPVRLEPVVNAIADHRTVNGLFEAVPDLLGTIPAELPALERAVDGILRVVARRGFVRIQPQA